MTIPTQDLDRWQMMLKTSRLLVILLFMRRHDKPVTQLELADMLGIDRGTAATYLRQLEKRSLIEHAGHHDGYFLTAGGRQMLLDLDGQGAPSLPAGDDELLENPTVPETGCQVVGENPTVQASESQVVRENPALTVGKSNINWGISPQISLKKDSLRSEEESIKPSSSDLEGELRENPTVPDVPKMLSQTSILFGREVFAFGIADRDPHLALSWIAQAYDQRDRLKSPWGVVYRRLQRRETPQKKYLTDPLSFLPEDYLAAVGLMTFRCGICDREFGSDLAAFRAHEVRAHPEDELVEDDVEAETQQPQPCDEEAARAWAIVLAQLQMDMPRASFDTWVRDTIPVRYEAGELTVAAHSAYARDWLESRLTSTVERLLVGILNEQHVAVRFIACEGVSVETEVGHE
jgi:DNA-binding MarR family transcriptional regulator